MRNSSTPFSITLVFSLMMAILITMVSYLGRVPPVLAQPTPPNLIASLFSFSGTRPDNLGVEDGHLIPCPESPNCVFSQSSDALHQIDSLSYKGKSLDAFEQLKTVVETMENTEIITENNPYLYAEFTTPIFGFVDDVEFYIDQGDHQIQVRSASRLGESDLGVNRRRVETIRAMFESLNSSIIEIRDFSQTDA